MTPRSYSKWLQANYELDVFSPPGFPWAWFKAHCVIFFWPSCCRPFPCFLSWQSLFLHCSSHSFSWTVPPKSPQLWDGLSCRRLCHPQLKAVHVNDGPSLTPPWPLLPVDTDTPSYHLPVSKATPKLSAETEYCFFQRTAGLSFLHLFSDKHGSVLRLTSDLPFIALYALHYGTLMTSIYQNIAENTYSSICA